MKYLLQVLRWSALVMLYSTMGGLILIMIFAAFGMGIEIPRNFQEGSQITIGLLTLLFSQIIGLTLALVFGEPPQKSE